jgi:signal transduction histidine kinase
MLDPDPEIDAYRIVQEAIGNAARHSRATLLWIDAAVADGEIRLEVGDNGRGLDAPGWTRGLGLAGMEERAAILNARFALRSRPGKGTVITVAIPIDTKDGGPGRPAAVLADVKSAL